MPEWRKIFEAEDSDFSGVPWIVVSISDLVTTFGCLNAIKAQSNQHLLHGHAADRRAVQQARPMLRYCWNDNVYP
jgi:hypothetical protein